MFNKESAMNNEEIARKELTEEEVKLAEHLMKSCEIDSLNELYKTLKSQLEMGINLEENEDRLFSKLCKIFSWGY